MEERRHRAGTVLVKDISPGSRLRASRRPDGRQRHAVLHGQRRRRTAASCGRATAPRRHRPASRTSTPARRSAAATPTPLTRRQRRRSSFIGQRRPESPARAVEERRHRGRHRRWSKDIDPDDESAPDDPPCVVIGARAGPLFVGRRRRRHGPSCGRATAPAGGTDPGVAGHDRSAVAPTFDPPRSDGRQRHAVLRGRRRTRRARSCGRATAPPPAPCWSRTSTRAAPARAPADLTNVNGTLFFTANDGDARRRSCGRATAPRPAPSWSRTSTPAAAARIPQYLTNVNGTLFFTRQRRRRTATSCGRATAPPPAPSWSRTSTRAAPARVPAHLTNVNGTLFFTANDGAQRHGAVEERRHRRRHRPGQGHQPGQRQLVRQHPDERQRHAVLHGQRRRRTAASCGRATAPRPAPCWSRTSTRAVGSSHPI